MPESLKNELWKKSENSWKIAENSWKNSWKMKIAEIADSAIGMKNNSWNSWEWGAMYL